MGNCTLKRHAHILYTCTLFGLSFRMDGSSSFLVCVNSVNLQNKFVLKKCEQLNKNCNVLGVRFKKEDQRNK
ncbi:hypothetical protein GN956_G18362 [Arapaima gigas]